MGRCVEEATAGYGIQEDVFRVDELPSELYKEEEIEKELTKQNQQPAKTGTKTTTKSKWHPCPRKSVLGISNLK